MRRVLSALPLLVTIASCAGDDAAPVVGRARSPLVTLGTVEWTDITAGTPPSRGNVAMTYDEARRQIVMFGGTDAGETPIDETWLWDGAAAWSRPATAVRPPARRGHAMAYDAARSVSVLFGGESCTTGGCSLGDTWEWDGTVWTLRSSVIAPSPRTEAAMAYDAARGRIVLFGGCPGGPLVCAASSALADTWEWDGAIWSNVSPPDAPPPRTGGMMARDPRGHVVLFGGRVTAAGREVAFGDTWTFDGLSWTPSASGGPAGRSGAVFVLDSARKRTVLHAGGRCFPSCIGFGDTWEWDGSVWLQRGVLGSPPDGLTVQGGVFDATHRNTAIVASSPDVLRAWTYAGYAGTCASDDECDTARCNGAICCRATCGACEDCDLSGTQCVAVRRRDDPDGCTGTSTCDPAARCKKKAGQTCAAGDECAPGFCAGGTCCGVEACGAYGCGADGRCLSACASSADCAKGFQCDAGTCIAESGHCEGDEAVSPAGARTSCAPFACGVGGCIAKCRTSDDCATGFACDGGHACVPIPGAPRAGGCAIDGRSGGGCAWISGIALALAALARRRNGTRP